MTGRHVAAQALRPLTDEEQAWVATQLVNAPPWTEETWERVNAILGGRVPPDPAAPPPHDS